ncbi:MAG TPA: PIG-L family deacetylase [Solirubrobacter sp.]|nr:PIG-L family deacetylase [Solirubrobacter sp.]
MLGSSLPKSAVVLAPHADDEAMGCSGLMAKLAQAGARIHVVYLAVDGFHHYGIDGETTYAQRIDEIEDVLALFGGNTTYEIVYGDQDLIEQLDTRPRRELVDRFERTLIEHRPELLLLPALPDYDQDHQAVFYAAHAAARPIAQQFGNHLTPNVLAYEMTKLQWAAEPLPRFAAFTDITDHIETKLEAVRRYKTMLRPSPHIRSLESVKALATIRGAEIGVTYAEAFQVLRATL